MGLTITNLQRTIAGDKHCWAATITFDSSYPTGGESLTPQQVGLKVIEHVDAERANAYGFTYDRTNQKLLAHTGGTEATNGGNLSTVSTHCRFYGRE